MLGGPPIGGGDQGSIGRDEAPGRDSEPAGAIKGSMGRCHMQRVQRPQPYRRRHREQERSSLQRDRVIDADQSARSAMMVAERDGCSTGTDCLSVSASGSSSGGRNCGGTWLGSSWITRSPRAFRTRRDSSTSRAALARAGHIWYELQQELHGFDRDE